MKRYERRRKPYRGRKRTDQRSGHLLWHRMLAVLVAAVTLLTGIELSGLEAVFAKETSGYQINISYPEGKDQAVLKGNTDNVSAGIALGELKDEEGNTFDPAEFEMTVTENGIYTYTLTYQETASQSGKQIDKEEKVSVTVGQIEKKTSETSAVSAPDKAAAQQSSEQQSAEQQPAKTLPISVLQAELKSLQQTRATANAELTIGMYAEELQSVSLESAGGETTTTFSGGSLEAGDVPGFQQQIENTTDTVERQFAAARVVLDGVSELAGVQITGLYPVQNDQDTFDWYYTTGASSNEGTSEPDYGDISVGYLVNPGDEVRFYYSSGGTEYEIENLPSTVMISGSAFDYNFTLQTNGKTYEGTGELTGSDRIKVKAGQKMIVEVDMSSSHKSSLLAVYKGGVAWDGNNPLTEAKVVSSYSLLREGETDNTELENKAGDTLKGTGELESTTGNALRYRVVLEMPAQNIAFRMHTFTWPTDQKRSFALYINQGRESWHKTQVPTSDYDGGGTRLFNTFVSTPTDGLNSGSTNDALINGTGVNSANKMTSINYTPYSGMWERGFGDYSTPSSGYAGTYMHVDLPNWPDSSTTTGTSRNFVRATGHGNLDGMPIDSVDGSRNVVLNPGSSQTVNPAFGHFYVGEPVGFRLETSMIRKEYSSGSVHGQYLPSVLWVDIYPGEDGSDITNTNFERHEIDLSSVNVGGTMSFNLDGNGRVLVKCLVKQGKNVTTGWNGFGNFRYLGYGTNANAGLPVIAYDITVVGVTRPFKLVYGSESGAQANHKVSLAEGKIQAGVGTGGTTNNITGSYVRQNQDGGQGPYRPLTTGTLLMQKNQPSGGFEIGILPMEGYSAPTITIKSNGQTLSQGSNYTLSNPRIDNQGRYVYTFTPSGIQKGEIWNIEVDAQAIDFQVKYQSHTGTDISGSSPLRLSFGGTESALVNFYEESISGSYFDGYEMKVGNVVITNNGDTRWQPGEIMSLRDIYQQARDGGAFNSTTKTYEITLTARVTTNPTTWVTIGWTLYKQTQWFEANAIYDSRDFNGDETGTVRGRLGGTLKLVGYKDSFPDSGTTYLLNAAKSTTGDIQIPAANDGFVDGMPLGELYYLRTVKARIIVPGDLASESAFDAAEASIGTWNTTNTDTLYTGADINQKIDLSNITLPETIGQGRQLRGWRIVKAGTSGNTENFTVYNYEIPAATSSNNSSTLDLNELGRNTGDGTTAGRDAWNAIFGTGTNAGTGEVVLIPYYDAGGKVVSNPGNDETTELKMPSTLNTYTNGSADPSGTGSIPMDATFYYTGNRDAALINNNLRFAVVKREFQRDATTGDITMTSGDQGMIAKVIAYGQINPNNAETPVTLSGVYNTSSNRKIGLGGTDGKGWEENQGESSFTLKLLLQNNITYQWDHKAVYSIHVWNDNNDSALYNKIANNGGWGSNSSHTYDEARQQEILTTFGTVPATPETALNVPGVSYEVNILPRGIQSTGDTGYDIVSGQQIQWKNSEDGTSRSFDVEFKFDNTVPWSVQKKVLGQTESATDETNKDPYYIRVVVVKKAPNANDWTRVQRLNQEGTFGTGQINDYTISLLGPGDEGYSGQNDRFLVRVTAGNNQMATSSTTFGTDFAVAAYNNQNGKEDLESDTSVRMQQIVSDYITNPDSKTVVGVSVPAVESKSIIYPKGVQVYNSDSGSNTLQTSQRVTKYNNQASSEYSAEFTYDTTATNNNSSMNEMYSTAGGNYFIGFYKSTDNGNSWQRADSLNGTGATVNGTYITSVSASNQTGRVTVRYKIPATDNNSNTQYRLVAFYGNIDGNNNITDTNLDNAMDNASNLAMVNITLDNTAYNRIESYWNNGSAWGTGAWNKQMRETSHGPSDTTDTNNGKVISYGANALYTGDQNDEESGDQDLVLRAEFEYDLSSQSILQGYWNEATANTPTATTDDGMGYYLNWVLYGYNNNGTPNDTADDVISTWLIREQKVLTGVDSGITANDITVDLDLGGDETNGTASDGLGVATITIKIAASAITNGNFNNQNLYLFAWNNSSNSEYKALPHTDDSGDVSPYTTILQSRFTAGGTQPTNEITDTIANAYWNLTVVPRPITLADGTLSNYAGAGEEKGNIVTFTSGDMSSQTFEATFAYDTAFTSGNASSWDSQKGTENSGGTNTGHPNRNLIRVALLKKDYGSNTWSRVERINADGGYGSYANNEYYMQLINNQEAGSFTVQVEKRTNALNASYGNYNAEYMIVAYNYQNTNSNMNGLWSTDQNLNNTMTNLVGRTMPGYKTTTQYKPSPMTTAQDGIIGHHEREIGKVEAVAGEAQFTFWPNRVSWTSGDNVNAEMRTQFDWKQESGNVIFTLWKRTATDESGEYTGTFTIVDSYNGGEFDQIATGGGSDYIKEITQESDGSLLVKVHLDAQSDKGQYRVFAWYANSNADGTYGIGNIQDSAFEAADPTTITGKIPYATGTVMANAADTYISIPGEVRLFDGPNSFNTTVGNTPVEGANGSKVYTSGSVDNVSDQYAGNYSWVTYNSVNGSSTNAPDIEVSIEDNKIMQLNGEDSSHRVDVYFADGYRNVTQNSSESGMVLVGYLSKTRTQVGDSNRGQGVQTVPIGQELVFWLNTTKSTNQNEEYTTTLRYHFRNVN